MWDALPCVLIEGRTLAGGASGRNGGVISPTHSTPETFTSPKTRVQTTERSA